MPFTMCDGSDYVLHAFYSFIELLAAKEMSCICHLTPLLHKKKQIHDSGTDFKESFKLF